MPPPEGDDEAARNVRVVRDYLHVFETRDTAALADLVAPDVRIHGATSHTSGRQHVENAIRTPGLSNCRVAVQELVATEDRVTVVFTLTYRHDRSGSDVQMSGIKHYRLAESRIVEFWGETDLYGLLRQLDYVPDSIPAL